MKVKKNSTIIEQYSRFCIPVLEEYKCSFYWILKDFKVITFSNDNNEVETHGIAALNGYAISTDQFFNTPIETKLGKSLYSKKKA